MGKQLVGICGCGYDSGAGVDLQVRRYHAEEVACEAVNMYETTRV